MIEEITVLDISEGCNSSQHPEFLDKPFLVLAKAKLKTLITFVNKTNARSLSTHIIHPNGKKYKLVYTVY